MSTTIRPETSKKKPYWIDRHRYYELRHFCLQYPIWKEFYSKLDGYSAQSYSKSEKVQGTISSDPVPETVERKLYFKERMDMIEQAAKETDPVIGSFIFDAVTKGLSYEHLRARCSLPCCKSTYYDLYRKFFWILSNMRK